MKKKLKEQEKELSEKTIQEITRKISENVRNRCAGAICNHCSDVQGVRATKSAGGRWVHKLPSGKTLSCEAWKIWEFA